MHRVNHGQHERPHLSGETTRGSEPHLLPMPPWHLGKKRRENFGYTYIKDIELTKSRSVRFCRNPVTAVDRKQNRLQ